MFLSFSQVLVYEKIGQCARHLLGNMGITRRIKNIERCDLVAVTHKLDVNVFTHELDFFIWCHLMMTVLIKVQLVDDQKKACTAKNLLRNTLQSVLQIVGNVWLDI